MASGMNKVYLQIVGCDTIDTTPSLLLFTDSKRYLFNCGEGTQRLFNENKLRIHKLNDIFFTRISWDYIGGLPGMAMTLRDTGKVNLGLHGPKQFKEFIHSTRHFMYQEKLQVKCTEFENCDDKFEDENLSVCPVILSGKMQESCSRKEGNETGENPSKRIKTSQVDNNVVSYICSLPSLPGKFLVKKAKEFGVPKGPLFGKLKCGEDIILDNGQKILAKDVTEPTQPGPRFFIVDCPSDDYIPSLVQSKQFSVHQPCLVIHLVPMAVFDNPDYKKWRLSFGESTNHLIMNKDICSRSTMYQSQARIQIKLHTLDKDLFPLLHHSDKPCQDPSTLPSNTIPGRTLLKFHLRPLKLQGFDTTDIPTELDVDAIIKETINIIKDTDNADHIALINDHPRVQSLLRTSVEHCGKAEQGSNSNKSQPFRENSHENACSGFDKQSVSKCNKTEEDFQVVFVGTGASLPSKYRNVSATLLHTSESSSILFDCGEGTLGQLYRHYGSDMDRVINSINCIFISHIHADHHLGLIRILLFKSKLTNASSELIPNETVVIGPSKMKLWLQEYSSLFEHLNCRFVNCNDIVTENHDFMDLFKQTQASELIAVPVIHCADAYGLVFKHVNGWKVVYSGDTRPCPSLVTAGRDASLLIHEATFEDELQEEALDKKHCTTTEAINIGIDMNAGFIMLNHFSQRYPKIPVISEQFTKHTGIAFDHMRVSPRDFSKIPSLFSILNVIFADEIEEMNKKSKSTAMGSEDIFPSSK